MSQTGEAQKENDAKLKGIFVTPFVVMFLGLFVAAQAMTGFESLYGPNNRTLPSYIMFMLTFVSFVFLVFIFFNSRIWSIATARSGEEGAWVSLLFAVSRGNPRELGSQG
jgi:type II secretory pathway component PulF